jgi:hypothetical protein
MKKKWFGGKPGESSRDDIERQAAAELQRQSRAGPAGTPGPMPYGGSSTAPTPYRPSPASYGTAPAGSYRPPPSSSPRGLPDPFPLVEDDEGDDDFDDDGRPYQDQESITEMALMQLAERRGSEAALEDFVIRPVDPSSAEAMRDAALAQFWARQEQLAAERREKESAEVRERLRPVSGGTATKKNAKGAKKAKSASASKTSKSSPKAKASATNAPKASRATKAPEASKPRTATAFPSRKAAAKRPAKNAKRPAKKG